MLVQPEREKEGKKYVYAWLLGIIIKVKSKNIAYVIY